MSGSAPDDRELEQLSADEVELAWRYRAASQDEPPVALDELIRAAARRQVRGRLRPAGSPFMTSWPIPLAIAAVVVVSVTVTVMVAERDARIPFPGKDSAPTPGTATGEARNQTEPRPAAPHALESQAVPAGAKVEAKARLEAAPAPASSGEPAGPARETGDRSAALPTPGSREELSPPKAEPAAEVPAPAGAPPAPQTPSPGIGPAGTALPSSRAGTLRDTAREQEGAEQTIPSAGVPQADVSVGEAPAPKAAPVGPMHEERGASQPTAEERPRAQALAKKQALPAGLNSEAAPSPWEKDPQAWLAHIDELRTAGRSADAKASFRAFRSRYPDYRLPAGFVVPGP